MRNSIHILPVLALTATPLLAGGEPSYVYRELGTLGGPESAAFGLNDARQVVGWAQIDGCLTKSGYPCRRAFLWEDGTMTDLGLLAGDEESTARAINNSGLIVGTSEGDITPGSGIFHGSVFIPGSIPTQLSDLGQGMSFAHDVNNAGVIAGHTQNPAVNRDTAVTWQWGVITDVGSSDWHSYTRAYGVSEAGLVTGFAWDLFQPNDAILYVAPSTWVTIGGTAGPFQNAQAFDVNDSGVAVGLQAFPQGSWHCAMWTQDNPGGTDLGLLPGYDLGELFDVNEAGWAVGHVFTDSFPSISRAVLWDGSQLRDLNEFLPAHIDAVLWEAREINENGDVVGTALVDGSLRAFILTNGPWEDLGFAMAGAEGEPTLIGGGTLEPSTQATLTLGNARPGDSAWLALGFSRIDLDLLFGTLVPYPNLVFGPFTVDAQGQKVKTMNVPPSLGAGVATYWQYWILDATGPAGWTASNGVLGITQ